MGKFTVIADDAFDALQLDAGVLLSNFDPANPVRPASEDIIATTTGGINPTCVPTYSDFGEDVDNVPINMMEFKHLDGWDCGMAFSSIKFNAENTAWALGASETTHGEKYDKIVPRRNLLQSDFKDLWWVGDKANGGAYAICLKNALSTGGLSIQSTKNGKGTNAVTITGHVSIDAQDDMPMEFYDIFPDEPTTPSVTLDKETATVAAESTMTLVATTVPEDATVTWTSSDDEVATVAGGVVTGVDEGTATITASISVDGTVYTDTCAVTVTA